jgi:hypothetical protein
VELLLHLEAARVLHSTARVLAIISARDMASLISKARTEDELLVKVQEHEQRLGITVRWQKAATEYKEYHELLVCRRLAQ